MHCELNSTLCEAVIAAAALAFFAAQPCSAATVRQTASKQSFEFTQRISPLTNTTVCHELYINETTAPRATLLESIAVVCPGACPWSTVTAQKGWSRFQPTTDMLNCTTPPECGGKIAANASKAMFTCPEVANLRGSCIQSPSNGCKYLGVFLRYGVSWGNDAWPQYDEISCAGPENGTCTWCSYFVRRRIVSLPTDFNAHS